MPFRIMLRKFSDSDQKESRASDHLEQELEMYPFGMDRYKRHFADGLLEDQRSDLEFELSQEVICIEALQQVAWKGLRHGAEMRPLVWKILLGYLSVDSKSWEDELTRHRLKYTQLKEEFLVSPSECTIEGKENHTGGVLRRNAVTNGDHPLSLRNGGTWNQYFKDAEIAEQIDRDLERTHPDIEFFSVNSPVSQKNQEAMRNILLLFAKMNPAIGYVQGMNEVLAPLYYVFRTDTSERTALHAEADSFGCFVLLLSGFVDNFCQQLDNSSVGIHATLSCFSQLLKANDIELWNHLENLKVNPQFYGFRWITLLLTQEFEFHSIMTIWDFLISSPLGIQEVLLRVCCAMLLCVRHELLQGDFSASLKLLQHYPQIDLSHLLDVACSIKSL